MVIEVEQWYNCHWDFLPDADFNYLGRICWYSHGTIDYLATARVLLQDVNLNHRQRFILSYKYCLQDEQRQPEEMFADDLTYVSRIAGLTTTLRSWMDELRSNNPLNWKQITHEAEFGRYYRSKKIQVFSGNYLGLLYYFKKLRSPEVRYRCLYLALEKNSIRPFYLYLCLARLPDYELDALFNRFSERNRYLIIRSFLHWPLQCIFPSIVERFRNRISDQIYLDLFKFILFEIFERELLDYEYVSLVKQLWAPLSENTKRFVRENGLYPL
ncbi:uncharacterized protein TNIN_22 [Trichonephila inaurata madagascariensis]|nr:uncharacterized protein TNIN_22 [Trichonephila inaurata madagascariensis]